MNLQELLAILQIVSTILGQLEKLIAALKEAGVDVSGVKLHTGVPFDLSTLLQLARS